MNPRTHYSSSVRLTALLLAAGVPTYGLAQDAPSVRLDPLSNPLFTGDRLPDVQSTDNLSTTGYATASPGNGDPVIPRKGCAFCTTIEFEEACANPIDVTNGGCNSNPPVYTSFQCGEEICGTFATDGIVRDTDWWQFEVEETSQITVSIRADVPIQIGLADLNTGCPIGSLITGIFVDSCEATEINRTLEPGIYAVFVAPQFGQVVPCGYPYSGELTCDFTPPCSCTGDFNYDGQIELTDLALLLTEYGNAATNRCMDADHDGVIGLPDLSVVLTVYGLPCP